MKQYMISVWHVEGEEPPSEEEMRQIAEDVDSFNARIAADGIEVVDASKSGDVLTTDGPFAEAKEQIGGFWILRAPDLDVALSLAAEASAACHGPVEVRPLQEEAAG
jgi:hypothetical protein